MFSDLSIKITKELSKEVKKNEGIYFTPPETIEKIINLIKPLFIDYKFINILENSCGSGEFIINIIKNFTNINIIGIEKNKDIYNKIQHISNEFIKILNQDFLEFNNDISYDLIIGNPPFCVIDKKIIDNNYYQYFDGRPNTFIIFLLKSLKLLNDNGIIAYVLPKSFLNCIYYNKTRKFIIDNYSIIHLSFAIDRYLETTQETIILIIQNRIGFNDDYFIKKDDIIILNTKENIEEIKEIYDKSTNLSNLNFNAKIGSIVWNENKDLLTDDNSKTRLIYNTDIKNNQLINKEYKNNSKKNYINKTGYKTPLLIINRGNGNSTYKFEYCLIDIEEEYLIENHLIMIKYNEDITNQDLIEKYKKIMKSFENPKTKEFIKIFFGNNAINIKELIYLLPIIDN
jgi:adenine-specific DNA-methyltransferase